MFVAVLYKTKQKQTTTPTKPTENYQNTQQEKDGLLSVEHQQEVT